VVRDSAAARDPNVASSGTVSTAGRKHPPQVGVSQHGQQHNAVVRAGGRRPFGAGGTTPGQRPGSRPINRADNTDSMPLRYPVEQVLGQKNLASGPPGLKRRAISILPAITQKSGKPDMHSPYGPACPHSITLGTRPAMRSAWDATSEGGTARSATCQDRAFGL